MPRTSFLAGMTFLLMTVPAIAEPAGPAGPANVIGGTAVPAGRWPDAVAVLGAQGSCTGTLIAPDVVLTAGHCADANPTEVIADTIDYNGTGGKRATVKSITAYPNWESSYDVAVIVLNAPITGVTPRKVGTSCTFEPFRAAMNVQLVGFGSTDIQGGGANTKLREASAPVTDPACTGGNGCVQAISPGGEFIAGGNGKDSCFGDSGGPVYLDTPRGTIVIGAVSRGLDNAATPCGGGGIYVRTDAVVAWIEATTGKTVSKDTCLTGEDLGEAEDPTEPGPSGGDGDEAGGFESSDVTGGCATSEGGVGAGGAILAVGLALARRRRRDQRAQD